MGEAGGCPAESGSPDPEAQYGPHLASVLSPSHQKPINQQRLIVRGTSFPTSSGCSVGNMPGLKSAASEGCSRGLCFHGGWWAPIAGRDPAIHAGLVALGELESSQLGSYTDATAVTRSANTRDTLEAFEDSFESEGSGLDPQVWIIRTTMRRLLPKGLPNEKGGEHSELGLERVEQGRNTL